MHRMQQRRAQRAKIISSHTWRSVAELQHPPPSFCPTGSGSAAEAVRGRGPQPWRRRRRRPQWRQTTTTTKRRPRQKDDHDKTTTTTMPTNGGGERRQRQTFTTASVHSAADSLDIFAGEARALLEAALVRARRLAAHHLLAIIDKPLGRHPGVGKEELLLHDG